MILARFCESRRASIFVAKVMEALCLVYILWFIGPSIWATSQGKWGILTIAVTGFIANMFVGGLIITLQQAMVKQVMNRQLDESAQSFL